MSYTEQDLSKLIGEVEKEFTAHLAKAEEASLAKSETANAEAAAAEAAPAVEAPAATVEAPLAKAEDEKDDEKCDYDEKDHEEMHKMYKSMTKAERKAHLDAISKCGEMSMKKSEETSGEAKVETPIADTSKEVELIKSEFSAKLAAEEAKSAELKKNLDAVSEFLTKFVKKTAPQGKAITNLDSVAKSESGEVEEKPLAKSEINIRLAKKAAEPSLAKSDRDAINAYYLNGADIKTVSHLLK